MKKKIEVYVKGCDDCERHDMDIKTCIGCGVSLCSFCANHRADKRSMATHNKHQCFDGFRMFYGLDYEDEGERVCFCLECLMNPQKHKIKGLFGLCVKRENSIEEMEGAKKKYGEQIEKLDHDISNKRISLSCRTKDVDKYWEVEDYNGIQGEEVKETG